jgi:hypothetical protein
MWFRAAAALLAVFCTCAAWAQGDGTLAIKPGLWRITSQVWLDGKEVLGELDTVGAQATADVLKKARAGMSPAERAEFDRNVRPPARESLQQDTECITPAEARMSPQAALQEALHSLMQPPWSCSITQARSGATGHSFDYRCRTPANATAEGKARFERVTESRYRSEIDGRSHLVDMDSGKPLSPRVMPVRSMTIGVWQAESCQP